MITYNSMHLTLGILGGGQLGKMLCLAAKNWGLTVVVLDPSRHCPAASVCDELIVSSFQNPRGIQKLVKRCDVTTLEIEHLHVETLQKLSGAGHVIYPQPQILQMIQDKYLQKQRLKNTGFPVPALLPVTSPEHLQQIGKTLGYPFLLKTRKNGYDGKGNFLVRTAGALKNIPADFLKQALFAEAFFKFDHELSVMLARNLHGQVETFPVGWNEHQNNILVRTTIPAPIPNKIIAQAKRMAQQLIEDWQGVGVFGIEFFYSKKHGLAINEIAPRVHNSGHYTQDACNISQFEQHLRAVMNLPLQKPELFQPAMMVNILGTKNATAHLSGVEKTLALENIAIHHYGKTDSKPARKMAHVNLWGKNLKILRKKSEQVLKLLKVD